MTAEDAGLWNSMVEEASRMQAKSHNEVLDFQMMQQFVSQINVELEPDDDEDYFRTNLLYQMSIAEQPNNPLLLLNYAQFLQLAPRDHDRGRGVLQACYPSRTARCCDSDSICRLLVESEERYYQAMAAEPDNAYQASKYANLLWSTGGEDTCFPLSGSFDNYKGSQSNRDNIS